MSKSRNFTFVARCYRGYGPHTCNKLYEGYVKYIDGRVVRHGGGTCYAPSTCQNCNEGYYPVTFNNGYCKGKISSVRCILSFQSEYISHPSRCYSNRLFKQDQDSVLLYRLFLDRT